MPAFSTLNVRTMYEGMLDICDQLLLKWERRVISHLSSIVSSFLRCQIDSARKHRSIQQRTSRVSLSIRLHSAACRTGTPHSCTSCSHFAEKITFPISFNSFYSMDLPKFIQEMTDFLTESNSRAYRPGILQSLPLFGSGTYDEDIRYMKEAARDSESLFHFLSVFHRTGSKQNQFPIMDMTSRRRKRLS